MRPIVIDAGSKKKLCMEMGCEEFVDFKETKDVPERVKEIADGIGAHGVLVTAYQSYKGTPPSTSHSLAPMLIDRPPQTPSPSAARARARA